MMKKLKVRYVENFPLGKIKIRNPIRTDVKNITALWKSIEKYGLQNPLIIDSKNNLIIGKRRLTALRKGHVRRERVFICDNPENIIALQLIENLQREDINPIDKAIAFKRLLNSQKPKLSIRKATDMLGISHGIIGRYLMLLKLPKDVQEKIARGHIKPFYSKSLIYKLNQKGTATAKDFRGPYLKRLLQRAYQSRRLVEEHLKSLDMLLKYKAEIVKTLRLLNKKIEEQDKKLNEEMK